MILLSDHHTSREIAVAPEIFGGTVDRDIDTDRERPLVERCREGVIGDRRDPLLLCERDYLSNIGYLHDTLVRPWRLRTWYRFRNCP